MPPDFWLALTAIGTLALAAATLMLGLQSRDAVRLGRSEAHLIEEQTQAIREQASVLREELDEMRRRDRPVLLWDQADMQPQFMWQGEQGPGTPLRIRVRCGANNHGGPARMLRAAARGDGQLDYELPQKHVPSGGSYFIDVGFGGLHGSEPFDVFAVVTQEFEALSTGERQESQVLVAMVSKWHGMNEPFTLVVPLDTEEARGAEGIKRWRKKLRDDLDAYIASGGG